VPSSAFGSAFPQPSCQPSLSLRLSLCEGWFDHFWKGVVAWLVPRGEGPFCAQEGLREMSVVDLPYPRMPCAPSCRSSRSRNPPRDRIGAEATRRLDPATLVTSPSPQRLVTSSLGGRRVTSSAADTSARSPGEPRPASPIRRDADSAHSRAGSQDSAVSPHPSPQPAAAAG
jgi:hypothetical protein